jgi:hypothetical protein
LRLADSQKRELAQLMLVAREYLCLADPELIGNVGLSETKSAFTRGRLSADDWSQVMKGAHLASAAIRLACIDDVLKDTPAGRPLYRECRAFFQKKGAPLADDPRGSTCSEWFHVMLRDSIGHREPQQASGRQARRYEARQRCIESTSFGAAYARLRQTEQELAGTLAASGVILPAVET